MASSLIRLLSFVMGRLAVVGVGCELLELLWNLERGFLELSFVSQSLHRINPGRSSRRDVTSQQSDAEQQYRDAGERQRVRGSDPVQLPRDGARKRDGSKHADGAANQRQNQALPQDHSEDVASPRS